jgi:ethanolamine-phosphate cytidylyltransferase
MKRLQLAKQLGDFLYVGIWDDEMCKYYRGDLFPINSLQERVLMTLSCKYVDDVVIGAPYIITNDLISSLKINKVVVITDTEEDKPNRLNAKVDQFKVPRELGILH